MPIAVAGAGPSSAAASTSARNEPEIRWPPWLTANQVGGQREPEQQRDERRRLPVGGASRSARRRRSRRPARPSRRRPALLLVWTSGLSLEAPALERPPEFHDDARIPQVRARGLLETAQPVAQRVGVHVQRAGRVVDLHPEVEDRSARCPRAPSRGPPIGARWRSANASPSASSARIAGRIERSARLKAPVWPNASAVCSARLACANPVGKRLQPRGRGEPDGHARRRRRGGPRSSPATSWSSAIDSPSGLRRPRARNGEVLALGVEPEGRALAPQLVRVERAGEQREDERVAALLLLARLLELDLAVRGADDVHHGVGPAPQRLAERQHGGDVGALGARELAEARPDAR